MWITFTSVSRDVGPLEISFSEIKSERPVLNFIASCYCGQKFVDKIP